MSLIGRYWHTMRHLRPVQIYGRVLFRAVRPKPDLSPPPPRREPSGAWITNASRRPSLVGPGEFLFLNERRSLERHGWDDPSVGKLWRYNQHYFDDLNALGGMTRATWHTALIERWMAENPPARGTGWEPYPTSLRIVNWIRWALAGGELSEAASASLAVQARWLEHRLERHLLGNHLFSNAKALVFAGLFFGGHEAARWLATGAAILERQLPEQILADGGQFELSPMYHALALEDLLDLINVAACLGPALDRRAQTLLGAMRMRIEPMRRWLAVMTHPDGQIAFFNDAATGIAASTEELDAYAQRLGFASSTKLPDGVTDLAQSGYLRVQNPRMALLIDAAPIGPDHLPGHAHADTLAFELSVDGRRVLVNSGTSEYGTGPERLRQRGTAAHNTVIVDDENSSEIWSGFRVARRARATTPIIRMDERAITISASHDGYRRLAGAPVHQREWQVGGACLAVSDLVTGHVRGAVARYHFHPDAMVRHSGDTGEASIGGRALFSWTVEKGIASVEPSTWHPEFGLSVPSQCLVVTCVDNRAAIRFALAESA